MTATPIPTTTETRCRRRDRWPCWRRGLAMTATALACALAPLTVDAAERVALLIGNAEYARPDLWLANPANDAIALAKALQELGFHTIMATDLDMAGMTAALAEFEAEMADAEIATFFYAGHGVQLDGENHLLAADFPVDSIGGMGTHTLTLGLVRAAFARAEPDVGVVILDACRDNPFEDAIDSQGLARVPGRPGLLIAYATDPGNVAYDGIGENSAFTESLVRHIATPGVEARLMFGRVRQDVIRATDGAQIPWVEEAVLGEHFFNPAAPEIVLAPVAADLAAWREASAAGGRDAYAAYLSAFPDGEFSEAAEARLADFSAEAPAAHAVATPEDAVMPLAALGYLGRSAAVEAPPVDEVQRALDAWARSAPQPADLVILRRDAARSLVSFGAATARQIRTDLVALESIDRAFDVALDAREELAVIAADLPEARSYLEAAEGDLQRISTARAAVMTRLDQAQAYYEDLLETARRDFGEEILAITPGQARAAPGGGIDERLRTDEASFIAHVRPGDRRLSEGSYAWLIDFLPES
ncbi:MAG: caspase family protein [Pseudomonadota bacterium]